MIHTIKGFGVVNKAEVDNFWICFAFSMIQQMLALWYLAPLPFVNPAWTSGSSRFMYYWSLNWRISSTALLACEMSALCSSLNILWQCLFLWLEWRLNFSSPVATAEFSKFAGILSAKFRLKWKKVGKTTSSFRYDLYQIPYDYTVEVTNGFKWLGLTDRVPERTMDGGSWHCTGDSDHDHLQEKENAKRQMVDWQGLTNSWGKRRSERQRRKGKIYLFECRVPKNSKER